MIQDNLFTKIFCQTTHAEKKKKIRINKSYNSENPEE